MEGLYLHMLLLILSLVLSLCLFLIFFGNRTGVRIIIPGNNNIQFCKQHENYFTEHYFCSDYDLVLVPGWVHAEVSHSQKRLDYLNRLPKKLLYMIEEDDYLPLIGYQDERLITLFKWAAAPHQSCQKVLNGFLNKATDIPDDWIIDFYESGFNERKKNSGEVSILALSFLVFNHFPQKINSITISTSDKGCFDIKHKVLENLDKYNLLPVSRVPISFMSTDILLVNAFKKGLINVAQVLELRPNPRTCVFIERLPDGTLVQHERLLSTEDFIDILGDIDNYAFIF